MSKPKDILMGGEVKKRFLEKGVDRIQHSLFDFLETGILVSTTVSKNEISVNSTNTIQKIETTINKQADKIYDKPTYLSLFSGAGIGCHGFKEEDYLCVATVEILERKLNIQRYNNKCLFESGYICGDIREESVKEKILKNIKYFAKNFDRREIDVLIATPPCQGMSVANHKKKNELGRNSLIVESIKLTKELNPKFFIFENVNTFLNTICTDIDKKDKKVKEAIENNLACDYNIVYKIINFKNYGSNSSRTRTLVIGVRKNQANVTPLDIFPDLQKEKTLYEIIGGLPPLKIMGEIFSEDIYHQFKKYSPNMREWIQDIGEGQSAFDNIDKHKIPHRIVNGKIVHNVNKNGDKYKRQIWGKVAPCIHTRNDIMASQNTVHPRDDRVFSIRELMRMMTIPDTFFWGHRSNQELNRLSLLEKKLYLKREEMNIRHSIGEAVPTIVFQQIAEKIKKIVNRKNFTDKDILKIITDNDLSDIKKLKTFIKENSLNFDYTTLLEISEAANIKKKENSAYYTRQDICYSMVKDLPNPKRYKTLRILEPSVGVGNFLPLLFKKYQEVEKVILDVVDIDHYSIDLLKILLRKLSIPDNFTINFIVDDFLKHDFSYKYDIVIGNPPFGKIINNKNLLHGYLDDVQNKDTNNIYSFFIEKSLKLGRIVALIVPKSIINSPEFNKTRDILSEYHFQNIIDYGEKGFKGVKIETISFIVNTNSKKNTNEKLVKIESYITQDIRFKKQGYIFDKKFPYWLIYRDKDFDVVADRLEFKIFTAFRDRQITKKNTKSSGKIRVLKSRNIISNGIKDISGYDCYVDNVENLSVARFLNKKNLVLVPNLTYNPRACFLPKNAITDGSVALLLLKVPYINLTKKNLEYFNTEEFSQFYSVARNRGTRSLNIDNNSVFFFGILKK
ncbi:DNA cytosine methyltransferase [Patescibacteria group bacterium AH-259-L05]|nr:DNA cytosine methyltransferase [Patescibacteria group bacterium AH-259-L05]